MLPLSADDHLLGLRVISSAGANCVGSAFCFPDSPSEEAGGNGTYRRFKRLDDLWWKAIDSAAIVASPPPMLAGLVGRHGYSHCAGSQRETPFVAVHQVSAGYSKSDTPSGE